MPRGFKRTLCTLAWLAAGASPAAAQYLPLPHQAGAPGLGLALRRLPVAARALYVTAHPDDEHNGVLVALSHGRGVATALLTLTRGEGGQNAIGPELFEALGVLRTQELAAVHRYDGVRQYFSQAFEFGFSVSLEETLARWGHEATLGDVVRVVRAFRPDVMLTLPLEAPGHQHHTAAAQLALEAFRAAADPARFPEQLAEGLRPWQARKLYQGGTGTGGGARLAGRAVPLALGARDPLLGASWMEFGSLARSFHKSQATRQLRSDPGEFDLAGYRLVDAEPAASASESDIFDGIDTSLAGLARFAPDAARVRLAQGLAEVQASAQRAQAQLDWRKPENVVPELREGLARLRGLRAGLSGLGLSSEARLELDERLAPVEMAFMQALALAHGLTFRVTSDDGEVTPGQSFRVTALAWNQGGAPLVVEGVSLALPEGWTSRLVSGGAGELAAGQGLEQVHEVTVAPGARLSRPYWHRPAGADRYELENPSERGLPWSAPPARGRLRFSSGGVAASWDEPAVFRYPGRWVGGEKQKTVDVVPELSVRLTPDLLVFPTGAVPASRELRVTLLNNRKRASEVDVSLVVPEGWQVVPRQAPLRLTAEGEEGGLRFAVTPPAGLAPGAFAVRAEAESEGRAFREGYRMVAYDHIEERPFYAGASSQARVLDVRMAPAARVGYVTGTGDEVPAAIEQLGVPVALLSGDDLAFGDLGGYSTIVLGVRAYQARADLRASHQRLMAYASGGGHLLVQYHQAAEFNPTGDGPSPYAPFPARVGTGRVTDETAPVRILDPESAVFRTPNRITEEDWKGWVQERGLQFLEARDARYRELLSSADPFPANSGSRKGLLVEARLGKGTWTYVGLALFRQLAAGTPGAYRLLANLLSRPRGQ
jgi:LmbE family N-acetylglucosaminyl deacetylase